LPISVNFMLDKTELTDSFMTNVSLKFEQLIKSMLFFSRSLRTSEKFVFGKLGYFLLVQFFWFADQTRCRFWDY
jgi:hypothetical protein